MTRSCVQSRQFVAWNTRTVVILPVRILVAILIFCSQNPMLKIEKIRLSGWKFNLQLIIDSNDFKFFQSTSLIGQFYRKCLPLSGRLINRNDDFAYELYQTIHTLLQSLVDQLYWGTQLGSSVVLVLVVVICPRHVGAGGSQYSRLADDTDNSLGLRRPYLQVLTCSSTWSATI